VTNAGDGPAEHIRVQGRFDNGLETADRATTLDETIASLAAGQSRTIAVPLSTAQGGKFGIQVGASGDRGLAAVPQSATVEVKEAQLALSVHGPSKGYVGQEATWQLVIRNTGDVPFNSVVVKAALPPGVGFVKATDGGKVAGKQVVWELGSAPARQERTVALTGICNNPSTRATLSATITGAPAAERDGATRPVKPPTAARAVEAAIEIVGVPALQMSVKDSSDPVAVGQRVTYTVRVKNAGTEAAKQVRVSADVPEVLRPTRGTGPGAAATIAGPKVTFPALDTLAPGAETTFVIEAEARLPGDARFAVEVRSPSQAQPLRAVEPTRVVAKESRPFEP
jgi:uncharacterized repeat protein (TIGR01451 family)